MKRTGRILLLPLVVLGVPEPLLAQCALCRDAVASSPPEVREAMSYAIIGLALTPYAVAALAAWVISPGVRREIRSRLRVFRTAGRSR